MRRLLRQMRRFAGGAIAALAGYLGAYNSVDPKRLILQGWRPQRATADEAIVPALSTLIAQCRHLERTSPTARGVIEGLVAELVASGIGVRPRTGDDRLDAGAKAIFDRWAERAGVRGESLWQLQQQAVREVACAGSVLWRWVSAPELADEGLPPVQILSLETEWLSEIPCAAIPAGSTFIRGVELDRLGRPVAYHLRNPDITRAPLYSDGERVPAESVLHRFERRRAGQTHGEPLLSPVVETCQQIAQLTDAELRAAVNTAAMAVFISTPGGAPDEEDEDGEPVTDIPLGAVVYGRPGEKPEPIAMSRPNPQLAPFVAHLNGHVAAACRISRRWLSRDTEGANYSRDRRDQLDSSRVLRPVHEWLGQAVAGDVYMHVAPYIFVAIGAPLPEPSPARARLLRHEIDPDALEDIDPAKDVQASADAIAAGLSTYETEISRRGGDWRSVLRQRRIEQQALAEAGLPLGPQEPPKPTVTDGGEAADQPVRGARAGTQPMTRRGTIRVRAEDVQDDGMVRVIASTDEPCDWGDWREALSHADGAIDASPAKSALLNHDRDQIIGSVVSVQSDGSALRAVLRIHPDARTSTGVPVLELVRSGALSGVSIGYEYRREDATWDEASRTLSVARWTLREISLTPVQADVSATVTRAKPPFIPSRPRAAGEATMNLRALVAAMIVMRQKAPAFGKIIPKDKTKVEQARAAVTVEFIASIQALMDKGATAEEIAGLLAGAMGLDAEADEVEVMDGEMMDEADDEEMRGDYSEDEAERAKRDEKQRAAGIAFARSIGALCRSLNVDPDPILSAHRSTDSAIPAILKAAGKARATADPKGPTVSDTRVTADSADKMHSAVRGALLAGNFRNQNDDDIKAAQGIRARGLEAVRLFAARSGIDASDLTREELAWLVLGGRAGESRLRNVRNANVVSGQFNTYVMANVIDKAIIAGFESVQDLTFPQWTSRRVVADFKSVTGAILNSGNLIETAENMPFPELNKSEGGYTASANMWGATMSLTLQALVNDDLGEFMRMLQRAGQIAARTKEKECFAELTGATWTGNTTGGSALGTVGNLDNVIEALVTKTDFEGNPLGNNPRFLLIPFGLRREAQLATGAVIPPGATTVPSDFARNIVILPTPYLTGTTYYIAADPVQADTVKEIVLQGFETPQVLEYDAGAVAARNWKIMLPFAFKPVFAAGTLRSTGAAYSVAPGMQQATA